MAQKPEIKEGGTFSPIAREYQPRLPVEMFATLYFWVIRTNGRLSNLHALCRPQRTAQTLASGYATQKVSGHPETDIVVSIVRIVPVAVSSAAIVWIVVPRTAAKHTNTTRLPFF